MSAAPAPVAETVEDFSFAGEARSQWGRTWDRFFSHRLAAASLVVLTAVCAAGFFAPQLAPATYQQIHVDALSSGPTWAHPFGTDQIGRDYFSRVLYGVGTETKIALLVGFFGSLIGILVGAVCGYFGGLLDNVLMRATDLFLTLPPLITVLVVAAYLHTDTLFKVSVLLSSLLWMPIARIMRATSLSLREREYVDAARAMGASDLRIIARHILPNAVGSIAVAATVMTAGAVILETTLSYLGFGLLPSYALVGRTQTGVPSLGDVLAAAANEGLFNWWGVVFPGLAVVFIVAPIYFIGDGIRDALDPTQRRYVEVRKKKRRRRSALVSRLTGAIPRPPRLSLPRVRFELSFLERLLMPIRRRRAGRRRLLVEAFAVLLVTAAAAGAVYVFGVDKVESSWALAGTDVQNVSRARGVQTEVAVAVSPSKPRVLFAASNDSLERTVRVYSSSDGGRTWSSSVGPDLGLDACAQGEPAVAVAPNGREYVAFTVSSFCTKEDHSPYLAVASRASPRSPWSVQRVTAHVPRDAFDVKPALAAAPDGRVFAAWSRLLSPTYATSVVSFSTDQGRTWSTPRVVSRQLVQPHLVSAAVDPHGRLYVAGVDARFGVWVARAADRGGGFMTRRAARLHSEAWNDPATCAIAQKYPTPFEAVRCLGPNPTVVATRRHVFVTYSDLEPNRSYGVHVVVVDRALRHAVRRRLGPPEKRPADQFWPAAAVDSKTDGIWACFYDTNGDRSRKQAWFSCSNSRDGSRWSTPARVARASASQSVLWEDARIYEFGDMIGYGGYTGLAVSGGEAHPMWIDTRGEGAAAQEVFAARLEETALPR